MTTMQGVSVLEQEHDHASQPSGSDLASDPAASLRALALSTLKSKRRKPPPTTMPYGLSIRPIDTTSSIQLDYGSEEPLLGVSTASSSPEVTTTPMAAPVNTSPTANTQLAAVQGDPGDNREEGEIEEGEISDTEIDAVTSPKDQESPEVSKARKPDELKVVSVATPPSPPSPSKNRHWSSTPVVDRSAAGGPSQFRSPSNPAHLVDAYHVRPGLASTCSRTCHSCIIIFILLLQ